jgi:hypothetical protein
MDPQKRISKQSNNKVEDELRIIFIKNAPEKYNREALESLFYHTKEGHKNEEYNFFFSRLNDFKKKINKGNNTWSSLFSEIHARYMIAEILKPLGCNVVFSKKDENDLWILKNDQKNFVEVKAIMPSDFQSDYDSFLKDIRKIPTGKAVSIKIKNNKIDRKEIFLKIKNKLRTLKNNYSNNEFEIKIVKNISDKNKTAFISPAVTFWVNQEGLAKVIDKKLKNKPKQIKKANIVCFYSFHNMFDSEDFVEAIKMVADKNSSFNSKIFACFTPWNNGQLLAIINENNIWSVKNFKDCIIPQGDTPINIKVVQKIGRSPKSKRAKRKGVWGKEFLPFCELK